MLRTCKQEKIYIYIYNKYEMEIILYLHVVCNTFEIKMNLSVIFVKHANGDQRIAISVLAHTIGVVMITIEVPSHVHICGL